MNIKGAWAACLVAGLAVLLLSVAILPMFPKEMATPNGVDAPVIAFEFARTQADVIAVFGEASDPLRSGRIASMDQGNRWDFAYMAFYSAFIALFFYSVYLKNRQSIWLVFAAVGILAGVADAIENIILFAITADLDAANGLQWLAYPVHVKFLSLYVCVFGVGYFLKDNSRKLVRVFALLLQMLAPIAVVLTASGLASAATLIITLAWLSQLVIALIKYRETRQTPALNEEGI